MQMRLCCCFVTKTTSHRGESPPVCMFMSGFLWAMLLRTLAKKHKNEWMTLLPPSQRYSSHISQQLEEEKTIYELIFLGFGWWHLFAKYFPGEGGWNMTHSLLSNLVRRVYGTKRNSPPVTWALTIDMDGTYHREVDMTFASTYFVHCFNYTTTYWGSSRYNVMWYIFSQRKIITEKLVYFVC